MTRHRCAVDLTATLAIVLLTAFPAVAAENAPGSFRVETAEVDLGTIIAGTTATATFVFHNDGPEDVHIIRAKPS